MLNWYWYQAQLSFILLSLMKIKINTAAIHSKPMTMWHRGIFLNSVAWHKIRYITQIVDHDNNISASDLFSTMTLYKSIYLLISQFYDYQLIINE